MKKTEKLPVPVTIVIPVYNEEKRIISSLETLTAFCEEHFNEYEILCVDDGSTDDTWNLIQKVRNEPFLRSLHFDKNRGKGFAVKQGMLQGCGRLRFFTDAELPYDLDAFLAAIDIFRARRCDIVTGDRNLAASSQGLEVGVARRVAGRVFSAIATRLLQIEVSDPQCGFKGFTDYAAQEIFSRLKISGYAFDVEIFALARAMNLKICRVPVSLVKHDGSKIRLILDPFPMFFDLLKLAMWKKNRGN